MRFELIKPKQITVLQTAAAHHLCRSPIFTRHKKYFSSKIPLPKVKIISLLLKIFAACVLIFGRTRGIRTLTEWILSPLPLPLGYCPIVALRSANRILFHSFYRNLMYLLTIEKLITYLCNDGVINHHNNHQKTAFSLPDILLHKVVIFQGLQRLHKNS